MRSIDVGGKFVFPQSLFHILYMCCFPHGRREQKFYYKHNHFNNSITKNMPGRGVEGNLIKLVDIIQGIFRRWGGGRLSMKGIYTQL